ncbi:BZ3500_MvSof-1268-A1-R1_Chr1-2g01373 [Microbotryum saponariae]|uniref:BZ3500_MvSof-1268-A1-R1_Chr1-2g01373 protein n=1 Tax=Microbotryum saponariae TaxID=289078 RepID=A0A2X0KT04_9BASI|nr:BZ3500_MvSof-1268-A1-R1_Chr1-2g01373 [Microbotryum saponariae]SCZ97239.1 BZ3501_MvSof-1269-A2-R1_Chr1-2g00972 [Microbotryum saponariae]
MVYSDASFADDLVSRRSVGSYASMLAGGAISWHSKQQSMIATSTTEAEILSTSSATREAIWLRRLAGDVGIPQFQIAKDPVDHMRTKHFDIAHLVRERVASGEVELEYSTHANAADMMTKPLGPQRFDQLRSVGVGRTVLDLDLARSNTLPNKQMSNVEVLGTHVVDRILGDLDARRIVLLDDGGTRLGNHHASSC